tara:strand:- start:9579 stop:9737 length:159 start_codon:yes stop_codon:yes gene_type:complete
MFALIVFALDPFFSGMSFIYYEYTLISIGINGKRFAMSMFLFIFAKIIIKIK